MLKVDQAGIVIGVTIITLSLLKETKRAYSHLYNKSLNPIKEMFCLQIYYLIIKKMPDIQAFHINNFYN